MWFAFRDFKQMKTSTWNGKKLQEPEPLHIKLDQKNSVLVESKKRLTSCFWMKKSVLQTLSRLKRNIMENVLGSEHKTKVSIQSSWSTISVTEFDKFVKLTLHESEYADA